jgi:GT2 family glycosyltransferase
VILSNELVSIIIINFNSGKYIFNCLEKLRAQAYKNIEIIIVDNCSTDGSSKELDMMSRKEGYYYYYTYENWGASKANNFGINNSHGDYVLLLNADMFLEPDYIVNCMKIFREDSTVGTSVGKFLSVHDHQIIDSAGIIIYKEGNGTERGIGEIDRGQYDKAEYVAGACCAAAVYRRNMLDSIKYKNEYFDEDFFAFYEDVDLSIRCLLKGWKTFYCPDAIGYHVRGASVSNISDTANYLGYRNWIYFYEKTFKHFNLETIVLHFILYLIRFLIVKSEFKRKLKIDLKNNILKLKNKRNSFFQNSDYAIIASYANSSYIVTNITQKAMNILSRIMRYCRF